MSPRYSPGTRSKTPHRHTHARTTLCTHILMHSVDAQPLTQGCQDQALQLKLKRFEKIMLLIRLNMCFQEDVKNICQKFSPNLFGASKIDQMAWVRVEMGDMLAVLGLGGQVVGSPVGDPWVGNPRSGRRTRLRRTPGRTSARDNTHAHHHVPKSE